MLLIDKVLGVCEHVRRNSGLSVRTIHDLQLQLLLLNHLVCAHQLIVGEQFLTWLSTHIITGVRATRWKQGCLLSKEHHLLRICLLLICFALYTHSV